MKVNYNNEFSEIFYKDFPKILKKYNLKDKEDISSLSNDNKRKFVEDISSLIKTTTNKIILMCINRAG